MKILHVIASVDPADGGPIEGIIQQNNAMTDSGVREIVTLDAPDAPFLKNFGMKIHPLGVHPYGGGRKTKWARFAYTPRLVAWLRENAKQYDIIVVNGLWNYASVGASRILPRLTAPYVVYPHGMLDPWFRRTYPWKHLLKQAFWLAFEGRLLRHAAAVLFTCEEEMILARGQFFGHSYREHVIGYGTGDAPDDADNQIAAFRAKLPELGDRRYLLFLSRIHPKKGCDLLIQAFAAAANDDPDLHLVIAGPDQTGWMSELQKLAETLNVASRIHWPGMLTGPAKWGAFRGAEAFILPSHQENFGIVVAEALASHTPVLITDKVNIWREVEASGAGLVGPDDQAGVTKLLRSFLELGEASRSRMRSAARACFLKNFDLNGSADKMLDILKHVTQNAA